VLPAEVVKEITELMPAIAAKSVEAAVLVVEILDDGGFDLGLRRKETKNWRGFVS
jgi:hypothetical protein